jgi:hypothetical protein
LYSPFAKVGKVNLGQKGKGASQQLLPFVRGD